MEKYEIARLVEKSRQGDNAAFEQLYMLTEKQAYYIALKIAKNEDDALDILQDSYIKAMQKMDTLENPENFVAWFNQIVANSTKNFVVKSKPMLFKTQEDEDTAMEFQIDEDADFTPDESLDTAETREFIRQLVDELPEDKRMCVLMFYFQNMSTAKIAEALDISEGTVKTRLYHSREKIRQSIEALQKKGVKVMGVAPIPFFVWMLRRMAESTKVSKTAATAIIKAATSSAAGTTAAAATAASATTAATTATTTVAGTAVATGVTAKVVAIVTAGAVVIGGGATAAKVVHDKRAEETTTALTEESTEIASENIAVIATEENSETTIEFEGSTITVSIENDTTVIIITPSAGNTATTVNVFGAEATQGDTAAPKTTRADSKTTAAATATTEKQTTTAKATTTAAITTEKSTTVKSTITESGGINVGGTTAKPTTTAALTTTVAPTTTAALTTTEPTTVGTAMVVIEVCDSNWSTLKTINMTVDSGSYITANTIKTEVLKYVSEYGESYTDVITIDEGEIISSAPGAQAGKTYSYVVVVS